MAETMDIITERDDGGDFYLCPLAETQLPPHVWEGYVEPLAMGQQPLARITRLTATGQRPHLADGYERPEVLTAEGAGHRLAWTERRLVVCRRQLARVGKRHCVHRRILTLLNFPVDTHTKLCPDSHEPP
jgi:hypothetical protein